MDNIKLVVLDLDGTVVKYDGLWHSSWDVIGTASGRKEEYDKVSSYYYPKKDRYNEWLQKSAGILLGLKVSAIEKFMFPPPYLSGVKDTVKFLKGKHCSCGLLTSGVDLVAMRVKNDLNLDFAISNVLEVSDGVFTGSAKTVVDLWKKDEKLSELVTKLNVPLSQVLFIGDHDNDISCMIACGHSIAFCPKTSEVRNVADKSFDSWHEIKEYIETEFLFE